MSSETEEAPSHGASLSRGVDLTTGSVVRHVITFSMPILLGNAFHTAYSIINAFWVAKGLGSDAMAAVTETFPIFFCLMSIAGGLTQATNILVSQAYGAKDLARLKNTVQNSTVLVIIASLLCTAVGYVIADWLLRVMGTPEEVHPMAAGYLRLMVCQIPFMFGVWLLASLMRAVGDSKTPLYFQAVALIVTMILDPLLIFGWLGFPRFGLNGTVVANLISQVGTFVALARHMRRKRHVAAPDWVRVHLDWPNTSLTLKIGVPSMAQQALVSLGMIFILGLVNRFGAHSAAAFGIAGRLDQLAFMPAMAIGMAVSTLAGQNIGAQRFDRVHQVFFWGLVVGCGITFLATLLALAIPEHLIRLFARNEDNDVVVIGAQYLRIIGLGYLLFAVMFVSNGVINGAGHTLATTMFTLMAFWAVRIPLATYLSVRLNDVRGVWYASLIGFVVGTIMSLTYYFSGRWRKSVRKTFS